MKDLSSVERRALRARAHSLDPVVIVGNGGLTAGVVAEVERSLKAHELIKIRIGGMDHDEREAACAAICDQTSAAPVQHIGKILVIYRKRPEEVSSNALSKPRRKPPAPGTRTGKSAATRREAVGKVDRFRAGPARRPSTKRG